MISLGIGILPHRAARAAIRRRTGAARAVVERGGGDAAAKRRAPPFSDAGVRPCCDGVMAGSGSGGRALAHFLELRLALDVVLCCWIGTKALLGDQLATDLA